MIMQKQTISGVSIVEVYKSGNKLMEFDYIY